jgi:hypothetical protein
MYGKAPGEGSIPRISLHQPREHGENRKLVSNKLIFKVCNCAHNLGPGDGKQHVLGWGSGRMGEAVDPAPTLLLHNSS